MAYVYLNVDAIDAIETKPSLREMHRKEIRTISNAQKQVEQRIANMWKRLNLHYDGVDYADRITLYPDECDDLDRVTLYPYESRKLNRKYQLWIIYDKNDCFSRCGTTDGSLEQMKNVMARPLWCDERYFVFFDRFTERQAKNIKQILRNVVSEAGFYAGFARPLPY